MSSPSRHVLAPVPIPKAPRNLKDKSPTSPQILTTAFYAPQEQFEVWRSRVSSIWDATLQPGVYDHGFNAEYLACNLSQLIFTSGHIAAQSLSRPAGYSRRSPVDHWMLVRTLSGEAWFETGERQIHAKAGDTYLISLDQDFRGRITDYQAQILYLPRDAFRSVGADFDKLCNMILPGSLIGLLGDHLNSLDNWLVGMSPEELARAGQATIDMITASIRPPEAQGAIDTALFERARIYIETHLANSDLAPEDLMQALGVSRSNLYRAFEHVGGVSRHIQRSRLLAARSALRRGGRIQDIAYNHGFSSGTVFARAFRREFGYSPSEVRDHSDPETGVT